MVLHFIPSEIYKKSRLSSIHEEERREFGKRLLAGAVGKENRVKELVPFILHHLQKCSSRPLV